MVMAQEQQPSSSSLSPSQQPLSDEDRDRLLERFPLTDHELDVLLNFMEEQQQQEQQQQPATSAEQLSPFVVAATSSCNDDDHDKNVQRQQVSPLVTLLEWSKQNVFVMGFENDPLPMQQRATFLEAAVSLLGRRGEAFLHRALFYAAAVAAAVAANHDECQHPQDSTSTIVLSVSQASRFLFRLVQMQEQEQAKQQQQQGEEPSEAKVPNVGNDDKNKQKTKGGEVTSNNDSDAVVLLNSGWMTDKALPQTVAPSKHLNGGRRVNYQVATGNETEKPNDNDTTITMTGATSTTTATVHKPSADPPGSWTASLRAMAHKERQNGESTSGNDDDHLNWAAWKLWITDCAPWIYTIVPTLFHSAWGLTESFRPGRPWTLTEFYVPKEWGVAYLSRHLHHIAALTSMLGVDRHLFGVYSSDQQGLAFVTLQQTLLGYVGPTLILLGTADKKVLGYYTQAAWKSAAGWHGKMVVQESDGSEVTNEAFLFSLQPTWLMFGRTLDDAALGGVQWLHMGAGNRKKKKSELLYTGLAIGGMHPDTPRLLITESLEQCQAMAADRSFASGCLLPSSGKPDAAADEECVLFDVDWIDVYAVVHDETEDHGHAEFHKRRAAGKKILDTKEWYRQRAAHVDKAQFVEDFATGIFGTGQLYAHREQARGRASFCAADDERKGYFIDGKAPSIRNPAPEQRQGVSS